MPVDAIFWIGAIAFRTLSSNAFPPEPLDDLVVEADEMYQNAGEKGEAHRDPEDPPRRRGNKFNGHGTYENDRPPILGVIGRTSGEVVLRETHRSTRRALQPIVESVTRPDATVNTDEWHAYDHLPDTGRTHLTVNHLAKEWARDDDGDGVREVHCNTMEGHWTGLRNFLRMFRGVHKRYLGQYVAFYQCLHNFRTAVWEFLAVLLGSVTPKGP
jgi:transposase-like protein